VPFIELLIDGRLLPSAYRGGWILSLFFDSPESYS
jgi:hypothetical protein